jgi:UDP-3-O-[3-hydroxymyristoyl] glucosamine N-acyltransferase
VIGEDVTVGKDSSIQAYAVIQDGAEIGDRTIVHPGSVVGHFTKIGADCIIFPRVVIRERITIGDRVIIHGGAIIGSDGFGFATVEGVHHKIPQIGTVVIEDDVEIGANTCVDRARFDRTIIKRGTKIDNLCQIAHNVVIGENSFIVAQTAIAGSARVGNGVILAGQTGVNGHIEIGDRAAVAGKSGVTRNIPPGASVSGFPAQPHRRELEMQRYMRKLPELAARIKELAEKVEELEQALAQPAKGGAP